MKIIVKTACLLFVGSLFLSACSSKEQKCNHKIEKINCYPIDTRPSNAITYKDMSEMFAQYEGNQKEILNNYVNEKFKYKQGDTKSNWFAIEELKQYIAYVERLSEEKDIKLTGIKIFSTAYPKDYKEIRYRGRQTLIFAPTAKIGDLDNVAYEPLKSSKGKPVAMFNYLKKYNEKNNVKTASFLSSVTYNNKELSSAANRASISPPKY